MNIKSLRKERGITQQVLADETGIDRALIARYENGSRKPPIDNLLKLSAYFNVSVDCILGCEEKKEVVPKDDQKKKLDSMYNELSPEGRQQAENYLRFLIEQEK